MDSRVEKVKIELTCVRCSRKLEWAWVIEYTSYRLTRFVYVCGHCGGVIKVTNSRQETDVRQLPGIPTSLFVDTSAPARQLLSGL